MRDGEVVRHLKVEHGGVSFLRNPGFGVGEAHSYLVCQLILSLAHFRVSLLSNLSLQCAFFCDNSEYL